MKKRTRQQLEDELRLQSIESGRNHCMINDILNDRVKWFRKGNNAIGISRPNGAEGGLIVHRFQGYASVYSWEDWYEGVRHYSSTEDNPHLTTRALASEAHNWILNERAKPTNENPTNTQENPQAGECRPAASGVTRKPPMKTTGYPGIDYTPIGDKTNRDVETGIRYGIISERSLGHVSFTDDNVRSNGDNLTRQSAVEEVKVALWNAVSDWVYERRKDEVMSDLFYAIEEHFNDRYEENEDTYRYEKDGYIIQTASNMELFVIRSPYYTYAQFCSPCVPGAGNLDCVFQHGAAPGLEGEDYAEAAEKCGFPKVYCLGPEWFDDEKAPYPLFQVKPTNENPTNTKENPQAGH
jgi:hypothetical protein